MRSVSHSFCSKSMWQQPVSTIRLQFTDISGIYPDLSHFKIYKNKIFISEKNLIFLFLQLQRQVPKYEQWHMQCKSPFMIFESVSLVCIHQRSFHLAITMQNMFSITSISGIAISKLFSPCINLCRCLQGGNLEGHSLGSFNHSCCKATLNLPRDFPAISQIFEDFQQK